MRIYVCTLSNTGVILGSQKWKHHGRPLPPNFGDKSLRAHAEV